MPPLLFPSTTFFTISFCDFLANGISFLLTNILVSNRSNGEGFGINGLGLAVLLSTFTNWMTGTS